MIADPEQSTGWTCSFRTDTVEVPTWPHHLEGQSTVSVLHGQAKTALDRNLGVQDSLCPVDLGCAWQFSSGGMAGNAGSLFLIAFMQVMVQACMSHS